MTDSPFGDWNGNFSWNFQWGFAPLGAPSVTYEYNNDTLNASLNFGIGSFNATFTDASDLMYDVGDSLDPVL
ncbi:hypothetical protein [Lucifera butyrica]|uniref:hypothetical protein n=1 Tax=Lucifera butyrica TaxID=1351585 RepID=UPI000F012CCE|nr:hypothetical protein [Lucifera butyrica]